ncbi:MAG: GNAT family N-acetyltransferase, partial [Micromonosporaceae bacterium]
MTNQETPIRIRTGADIPGCVEALRDVYRTDGYPVEGVAQAEKWLHPDNLLQAWVAGPPDNIVGHTAICRPEGEAAASMLIEQSDLSEDQIAVIARLFVISTAREQGTGTALAAAAWSYAKEHDRHIVFDVMAKDRAAISLYERLGCIRLGETMHTFGDNEQTLAYC